MPSPVRLCKRYLMVYAISIPARHTMPHYVIHKAIGPKMAQAFIDHAPQGKLNGQTIHDDGEGNLTGFVAEQYMFDILTRMFPDVKAEYTAETSFDYDILINGHRVDVKSKMRTANGIRPDWDVSIAEYTISRQQCDTYAFCSVTFNRDKTIPTDFYYVGMMSKAQFLQEARVLKQGQFDGDNILPNGQPFRVRKDCRNLKFSQLLQYDMDKLHVLEGFYNIITW